MSLCSVSASWVVVFATAWVLVTPHEDINAPGLALVAPAEARDINSPESASRSKRQSCGIPTMLTSAQQTEMLNAHNMYRGQEPNAADLLQMNWDVNLAARSQQWASQCVWDHNMLSDCAGQDVGQNMWIHWGDPGYPVASMTSIVDYWYRERQFWNFATSECQAPPGQVCGHYTQVIWDTSSLVGCGIAKCPTVAYGASTVSNAVIVVCDYSPTGNVVSNDDSHMHPFIAGPACSQCSAITRLSNTNRGYKCVSNLCVPCNVQNQNPPGCQCGPTDTCNSVGTWDNVNCRCVCPSGWFGTSCERPCIDVQPTEYCMYYDQVLELCDPANGFGVFMTDNCAKTCQLCS